jgi:hypothetical protein
MKRLVFMLFCLLCSGYLRAQESEVTITGDIPAELHHIYAPLDKSQVPTGFLLEQAMPFAEMKDFDGQALHDYNRVDIDRYGMIYATMYAATVQAAQKLPEPSVYMDKIPTARKSNVPLAFLFMDYNEIDSMAVINNLLTYNNGQLHDVANRSRHPYLTNTLFIASPLLHQFQKGDIVTFSLSSDLLIGNRRSTITSIEVDLGNGFRTINVGGSLTVTLNGNGLQPIVFKITDNTGHIYTAHSQVNVNDPRSAGLFLFPSPFSPKSS